MMNSIDGVGGVIVPAIGLNLLKIKDIKAVDMLPALVFVVMYGLWPVIISAFWLDMTAFSY